MRCEWSYFLGLIFYSPTLPRGSTQILVRGFQKCRGRTLEDSQEFLRISWDSEGFWGILENSAELRAWGFLGFCEILLESLGILGDSPGLFEKCTRFLKCLTPRPLSLLSFFYGLCYSLCLARNNFSRKLPHWFFKTCDWSRQAP